MNSEFEKFKLDIMENRFPVQWPGHLIGKRRVSHAVGDDERVSLSPLDGSKLMHLQSNKKYLEQAVDVADTCKRQLIEVGIESRMEGLKLVSKLISSHKELIEKIYWVECGKPKWEAEHDIQVCVKFLDWVAADFAQIIPSLLQPAKIQPFEGEYYLQPVGTALGFMPFSAPLTTFVNYLAASMIAGCPLIVCASSHTAILTSVLSMIIEQVNLPEGALSVFSGGLKHISPAIRDKRISALMYVGSHEHCERLKKESSTYSGRQLVLQSGGKNSVLVHSSADMNLALDCVLYGAFKSTGQMCTSTSRVFVDRTRQDEFIESLKSRLENTNLLETNSKGSQCFMGPLNSMKAKERFQQFQTMAARDGEVIFRGKSLSKSGYFVSPGVHYIEKHDPSSAYQKNVLFCPDIAIYPFDHLSDAVEDLSKTDSAFAVSFMGDSGLVSEQLAQEFKVSNIIVNAPTCEQETTLPLSGRMKSGGHRFSGIAIALKLCYPQIVQTNKKYAFQSWPKPWKSSES